VSTIKPPNQQKKVGRPRANTQAVNVRLPVILLDEIDKWRAEQRPIPSRPLAIRCFIEAAFQSSSDIHPIG